MLWANLFIWWIDKQAKQKAQTLISTLAPFAEQQIPIVGLEPSCLLALRDELPSLLPTTQAKQIASMALTFEELLAKDTKPTACKTRKSLFT